MNITNTVSYSNDNFSVRLRVPTLRSVQGLADFVRPYLRSVQKEEQAIPDVEDFDRAVTVLRPFIVDLTASDGSALEIDWDDISFPVANFLLSCTFQLYAECFAQSEVKKK